VDTCDFESGTGAHLAYFIGRLHVYNSFFVLEDFLDDDGMFVVVLHQFNAIRRLQWYIGTQPATSSLYTSLAQLPAISTDSSLLFRFTGTFNVVQLPHFYFLFRRGSSMKLGANRHTPPADYRMLVSSFQQAAVVESQQLVNSCATGSKYSADFPASVLNWKLVTHM